MRIFPDSFDPSALKGPRAKQFPRREDAFQQLVGEGLRELHGGLGVFVSTTRGADGSIDAFIEAAGPNDRCLPDLPKPLIVECKDHDEAGRDLRDNVLKGWKELAERLSRKAAAGWPGDFAPWRSARAYVYCVSARLAKLQSFLDLRGMIQGFFDTLPNRPPLEAIEVLDWSQLRALWDGTPRLADRWLGVGLEALLSHAEQLERFTGFRSYLLESSLPFLVPPADDPAHPDALLARLTEPGRESGLLLEGPGGVGKSRTLVEVAVRADAAGWRVLHAQAGEPALADDDLDATILVGSGPTLLVLDYLDQMQLDLVRLRQRLMPAATARGMRLVLLANARSGRPARPNAAREVLFEIVPLRPTGERARAITDHLLAAAAPRALEQLGHKRLTELCGERPIVALFIAREIERRADAGTLEEARLGGVRSGDLTGWLRRRLAEGKLVVFPSTNQLEPATPGPPLVAIAAILAAAPQTEAVLSAAGERALRAAGLNPQIDSTERSRWLISLLQAMGWLEQRGLELAAAHDVVADEVVCDVLTDRPSGLVRKLELGALFAPTLGSARTLGRLAVAIRRVLGMEGLADEVAKRLGEASAAWLGREAAALGRMLVRGDADEVSFALGDVVYGPPWASAALEAWDLLIAPFLAANAGRLSTRHLLYRGLSSLPQGHGGLLFPAALRWLERNGRLAEASFVLGPLLRRLDLAPEVASEAVEAGVVWFEANATHPQADFVFSRLLRRPELEVRLRKRVLQLGIAWLRSSAARDDRDFALRGLLKGADLLIPEDLTFLIVDTLAWLGAVPRSAETVVRLLASLRRAATGHPASSEVAAWEAANPVETSGFYSLTQELAARVREGTFTPTAGWLDSVLERVEGQVGSDRPAAVGYALQSLLPLAVRSADSAALGRVCSLTERFWREPGLTSNDRSGFARACYRYLAEGAWPDPEAGAQLLLSLGIERPSPGTTAGGQAYTLPGFFSLTSELAGRVLDSEFVPSAEWLDVALEQVEDQLGGAHPASLGYALRPLLPLAAHCEDSAALTRVCGLAEQFWKEPGLTPSNRNGFALACYHDLDNEVWPDRETGERLLSSLGIERPSFGAIGGGKVTALPQFFGSPHTGVADRGVI